MELFKNEQEIPSFPGYYISQDGTIYSYRSGSMKRNHNKPLQLKQVVNFEGYLIVTLYRNKKRFQGKVHRLVLSTFNPIDNEDSFLVRHLDDDKTNNAIENLAWGTPKDNSIDMVKNNNSLKGEKNHEAKLTKDAVLQIRYAVSAGVTQSLIAKCWNISKGHVSNICARRVWQHV